MSPIMKLALPMLAVAGSTYAACSGKATMTIQNSGDASAIATCKTYTGDIAIKTDVAEPIALDGVQVIDGSLTIQENSDIQQLSADSLTEITKTFELNDVQRLNSVLFPKLKTVGVIKWIGLPSLQSLGFAEKITEAGTVNIENTDLNSLDGLDLETVGTMIIANNRYIESVVMQLENITDSLTLTANHPQIVVEFPNLVSAFNMTFRNCSSVKVPSLEKLENSLNLIGNVFTDFIAPNLTEVGGALAIASNFKLDNVSFPLLTEIGDNLQIANNTNLAEVDGFPKLETISGALDFNGNMTKIDLPELKDVKGAFNIQSTGDVQKTCDEVFLPLSEDGKIRGDYVCKGQLINPGGQGTDPNDAGSKDKKEGAASAINIQFGALFVGLAAAFFL